MRRKGGQKYEFGTNRGERRIQVATTKISFKACVGLNDVVYEWSRSSCHAGYCLSLSGGLGPIVRKSISAPRDGKSHVVVAAAAPLIFTI